MDRPRREHLAALVVAGTALALVGGICGYFGTDFGYHLWSAGRCPSSSCVLDDAPWWMRTAGALAGSVAYVGLGLLAGLPFLPSAAEPASPPTPPEWAERVAAALAHVGLWLACPSSPQACWSWWVPASHRSCAGMGSPRFVSSSGRCCC